jgi:GMP synthase-like glutamine amidotransferase
LIGILNAYHFDPTEGNYQETYKLVYDEYFKTIMPGVEFKTYNVGFNDFPKSIDECQGWVITGSPASCYDDFDWIEKLKTFTLECHKHKKKLLGICFGHQLIASALGGRVEKSDKGWGVGVRKFKIKETLDYMQPKLEACSLLFSHQDQVLDLPPNSTLIGSDSFCPNQIFSIEKHIFSIQGHPEFTRKYAKERFDTRVERLGVDVHKEAIDSLALETDEDIIGAWIRKFFA